MQIQKNILIALIVLACLIPYFNTLFANFVWDDTALITGNSYIRSFRFLPKFFMRDIWNIGSQTMTSGYYRPLQAASFMLDYSLWRTKPFGYHLTNLVFHTLVSILVFLLIEMISKDKFIAFGSALLFSVHPIHTESVSFISGRVDVICLFFFLLSLWLFLKYVFNKKNVFYLFSLFSFFVSLLIKEMAVTLPLIIIFMDYLFLSKQNFKNTFKNFLKLHLGFFIILGIYFLMRCFFVGWSFMKLKSFYFSNFLPGINPYWRFFTVMKIIAYYIRLLVFPYGLKADYIFPPADSLLEPYAFSGFILLLLLFVIAIKNRRNNPILTFSIGWFFIGFLPVSNIFPTGNIFAERFMYIPSVGFCVAVGFLFSRLLKLKPNIHYLNWYYSIYLIFFLLIIFFSRVTNERNKVWKNDFTLWYETIKATPYSPRAHLNLANVYHKANLLDQAIEENNIALKLHPESYYVFNNAGNIYLKKGLVDEAIKAYKIAIERAPDKELAYNNLAAAYGNKGQYKEAIEASIMALKNNPYLDEARFNLAQSYARAGLIDEAINEYEKYLKIHPEYYGVHVDVGYLYYKKRDFPKAKSHWLKALKIAKDYKPAKEALKLLKDIENLNLEKINSER